MLVSGPPAAVSYEDTTAAVAVFAAGGPALIPDHALQAAGPALRVKTTSQAGGRTCSRGSETSPGEQR